MEAVHYGYTMKKPSVKISTHQDLQGLDPKRWAVIAAMHSAASDGLSPSCTNWEKAEAQLNAELKHCKCLARPGSGEVAACGAALVLHPFLTHLLHFLEKGHNVSPQLLQFLLRFLQLSLRVAEVFFTGFGPGISTCLIWIAQVLQTYLILFEIFFLWKTKHSRWRIKKRHRASRKAQHSQLAEDFSYRHPVTAHPACGRYHTHIYIPDLPTAGSTSHIGFHIP